MVRAAARPWVGQQVGVRVPGVRALAGGAGRTDSEHPARRGRAQRVYLSAGSAEANFGVDFIREEER